MSLEAQILACATADSLLTPLPTTRVLGERFGVSHVTVSRLLRRMADQGVLWQAENGRFYQPAAAESLARVRPVGCLIRSISGWASWYEQLMRGVGLVCEEQGRSIHLNPVQALIRQKRPDAPTYYAPPAEQRECMENFLKYDDNRPGMVLLDDAWSDEVLRGFAPRLPSPRLLLRPAPVPEIEAFYPDYSQGAMLGLSHLLGRGFRQFIFVQPYPDYQVPCLFQAAFKEAFDEVGEIGARLEVFETQGARRFPELIQRLRSSRDRIAVVCPEDNFSVVLLDLIRAEKLELPTRIGFLGGMGSPTLMSSGVTCVLVDFVEIGRRAVLGATEHKGGPCVRFKLRAGDTT